ncbi:MAG: glycosyltransferase family 2 protein [Clostridium saudiense]|uniref:glycosyltransferase family 2 protein n=1 Tax=Clostridium saudiense TaxID=1414720 RepID=UPI0018AB1034|nr:glycosyltransferase family 2 protein [Clostridium saudiense]
MKEYKVSILIPVYNTEKTLSRCLESVINQSLEEIEIIITNDGSVDGSQSIIDNYIKKDNRIKCFYQENSGLGATRNNGIEIARGEYIAFLDSDDYVDLDYYEKMYEIAKIKNADMVISGYVERYRDKSKDRIVGFNNLNKEEYCIDVLNGNIAGFSWNKLYRRELINKNKLKFPLRSELENVEDQYFTIRCLLLANDIVFMDKSYINYCINVNSIVQSYQPTLIKDVIKLYDKNLKFVKENSNCTSYIEAMNENLVKSIISIINNEFKVTRKCSNNEKLKSIKSILEYHQYCKIIASVRLKNLSTLDKIYYILLKNKLYRILCLVAAIRCKRIYRKQILR